MPAPDLNALACTYRVPATLSRLSDDVLIVQEHGGRWRVRAATLPGPRFLTPEGKWGSGGSPEAFTSPEAALAAVMAAPPITRTDRRRAKVAAR